MAKAKCVIDPEFSSFVKKTGGAIEKAKSVKARKDFDGPDGFYIAKLSGVFAGKSKQGGRQVRINFVLTSDNSDYVGTPITLFFDLEEFTIKSGERQGQKITVQNRYEQLFGQLKNLGVPEAKLVAAKLVNTLNELAADQPTAKLRIVTKGKYRNWYINGLVESSSEESEPEDDDDTEVEEDAEESDDESSDDSDTEEGDGGDEESAEDDDVDAAPFSRKGGGKNSGKGSRRNAEEDDEADGEDGEDDGDAGDDESHDDDGDDDAAAVVPKKFQSFMFKFPGKKKSEAGEVIAVNRSAKTCTLKSGSGQLAKNVDWSDLGDEVADDE